jgi:hypothetical protein
VNPSWLESFSIADYPLCVAAPLEQILEEALALPDDSKLMLAERLVESVSTHVSPEIERQQLVEVQRRIEETDAGRVRLISGDAALRAVRDALDRG